eukprot:TRINITY_DN32501_c0_g1_i1.p1 TRINITY_DN32501_c0_g1~~TRINITY_DN32501_c0_g1_i1.p1  ORF type:complete len:225 (+),score=51.41 TRINITY_DN32501_c0_g1_i1:48-722(+)
MGTICSNCEADVSEVGLGELKKRFEGQTRRVQPNPAIDPEVFVTFLEISKKDGGSMTFSPSQFTMNDMVFKTSVEIKGTATQIAAAGAAKGTEVAAKKLGHSEGFTEKAVGAVISVGLKATAATEKVAEKLGIEAPDTRTIKVDVTVDLVKVLGQEEVSVTVKEFHTDVGVAEKILSVERIRKFVEYAISQKASEIAARIEKAQKEKALAKIGMSQAAEVPATK